MRRPWRQGAALLLAALVVAGGGIARAAQLPASDPYEMHYVKLETGESLGSIARWETADVDAAMAILDRYGISPMWPTALPPGFDPDQAPEVVITTQRDDQDFAAYRTGEMIASEEQDGERVEYWPVDAALFDEPDMIAVYFRDVNQDHYFGLLYRLFSPRDMAARNMMPSTTQTLDNGMAYWANEHTGEGTEGVFHWRQIHLVETADMDSLRGGNRSTGARMVLYEVMSPNLDMELLLEVAAQLAPYDTLK